MTTAETLRSVLERNSTAQLMEGVLKADAECAELLAKADVLHRGYITDPAEAYMIRYAASEIVRVMESAVIVRDMVEERPDFNKAAKSLELHPEVWAPNLTAYEAGHADVQARIEDAIAAIMA